MFMCLDLSAEQKQVISQILYNGKYNDDYDIGLTCTGRFNLEYNALGKLSFPYLFLKNPETFKKILMETFSRN